MILLDETQERRVRLALLVTVLSALAAVGVSVATGQWFAALGWWAAAGAAWIARMLA